MKKKQAKLQAKKDRIVNVLIPPAPTVSEEAKVSNVDATTDDNEEIAVDVDIPVSTESRLREVLPKATIKAFNAIPADFGWSGREFDLETLEEQELAQLRSTL